MTARRVLACALALLASFGPPAGAATRSRVVVEATASATTTVSFPRAFHLDPDSVSVSGGGRVLVLYLTSVRGPRAGGGFLGVRRDTKSSWGDLIGLGTGARLPAGSYRLTVVTDARAVVSFPGPVSMRVTPRHPAAALTRHRDGAAPAEVWRVPLSVRATSLVVVAGYQATEDVAASRTDVCLTVRESVCQAGGVRPLSSLTVARTDSTAEVLSIYEPGTVVPGPYDAVIQAARPVGSGVVSGTVVSVSVG